MDIMLTVCICLVSWELIHSCNGNIILRNHGIYTSQVFCLSGLARVCCQSQDNTCLKVSHYCSQALLEAGW